MSQSNQPVARVRIGSVQAAIWENETKDGVIHNVTIDRRYQDKKAGEWRTATSWGFRDLLTLRKVADLAHSKILELRKPKGKRGPAGAAANDDSAAAPADAVQSDAPASIPMKQKVRAMGR